MKKVYIVIIILIVFLLLISVMAFTNVKTKTIQSDNYETNYNINDNSLVIDMMDSNSYIDNTANDNNIDENEPYENTVVSKSNDNEPKYHNSNFELPLNGCTGYSSVTLPLYAEIHSNVIMNLKPGQAFKVLQESGDFFQIELEDLTCGFIESKYCLINLPDVMPSIIYDDTNSYASIFKSSGYSLENITGKALYSVYLHNNRLGKDEYIMPLLYPMAKKIGQIQKKALENGDCLKIYETFRPYEVQMKVSDSLTKLMDSNEDVRKGIETSPWNKSWFIAVQLSNHQRGIALDVSLSKIQETEYKQCGSYKYLTVSKYEEYKMPTQMHELSKSAATFVSPVDSKSKTAWKNVKLAASMNNNAIKLQNYFTTFGLTPLASEWWHFNDLDTGELTKNNSSNGKFYLTKCLSTIPN